MAFSFDSLTALLLLILGIWSWRVAGGLRARLRVYLRFAAVLLAALAASLLMPVPGLAYTILLLISGAAGVALALAFCFPQSAPPAWFSATALVSAFAMGLFASLSASPLAACAVVAGAAIYIFSGCYPRAKNDLRGGATALLGAASLGLGGLAMMDGGLIPACLFYAAALGLVTRALQKPVEAPNARIELLIGGKRA
jgi:hypothetical protein